MDKDHDYNISINILSGQNNSEFLNKTRDNEIRLKYPNIYGKDKLPYSIFR